MVIKVSELLAHNTLVIDDFSPTLGGNLDTAGWEISNTGAPVTISGNDYPFTTGTVGQVLTTDGLGTLTWEDTVVSFSAGTTGFTPLLATTGAVTLAGTLNVASGGTGITTFSSGDILYASAPNVWSTAAPGTTSGVQAWDADLDALAAQSGTGISVRTGAGSWTTRTLVAPAAGITITNPSGVAGNPTFALSNDLAGLEGLTTTGYSVRTGDGTWTTRTITGTSGQIAITNNDGVASNTDIGLATLADSGTGTFLKITRDTFGRVSGTTAVVTDDITTLVNNTYVNITGDTMTGSLIMSGASAQITLPNLPVSPSDAANKAYVDSIAEGLNVLAPTIYVEATGPTATYSNGAAGVGATLTNAGTQIAYTPDGTAATLGQRILVKGYDTGVFGFDTLVGGSGYLTPGLYSGVALTGGTGTGATADITVTGSAVTLVTLVSAGTGYTIGDSLSATDASLGGRTGGSAFSIPVASLQNAKNGIYTVTTVGSGATNWVLTRATDFDTPAEVGGGDFVFNQSGATYTATGWVEIETTTAIGTSTITFQQFSGAGSYTAGAGLTLTGTVFSANVGSTTMFITGGNQLAVDSSATANQVLLSSGTVGNEATYGAVPLGNSNAVTGTLLAVNGGTGFAVYAVGDLLYADTTTTLAKLADVAAGSYLRSGGVSTAPVWSTTTLPNSATTGDLLYASASNTYSNLADVATGNVLRAGGVGVAPSYGQVVLTTDVTGTLPVANGGTGQSTLLDTAILIGNGTGAIETSSLFTHNTTSGEFLLLPASNTAPGDITIVAAGKSTTGGAGGAATFAAGNGEAGSANGGSVTILGGSTSFTGDAGAVFLRGGASNGTAGTGGNASLEGGASSSASTAGSVFIDAGENYSTGNGGNVRIRGGRSTVAGGYVRFDTATTGAQTERFRILANGAWSVGPTGTETGTAGQVLTSAGSGAVPTWSGPNTASGDVKAFKQTVSLGANTTTDIGTVLPTGATILSVKVNVTVVNTTSTLSVGIGAGPSDYMTVAENDPQTLGLYLAETMVVNSAVQIIATVAAQTGGVGSADVVVTYQIAN